jgi:membrane peptidoglycan carboxypeptidase
MVRAYRIIHNRRRHRQTDKRHSLAWQGLSCSALLVLGISIFLISASIFYAQTTRDLPPLERLPLSLEPPNGYLLHPTQLFDRTGSHIIYTLSHPAAEGSQYLTYDQFPEQVVQAILASADPTFWQNPGFSWSGLAQGTHPTLVQQLVSQVLLNNEKPGLRRNLRERLLAAQVLQKFGREKVLEWYLNTLEFGTLVYGIDAAAQVYFGKSILKLDLAEACTLAVLAQNPEVNPFLSQQALGDKRNLVLQEMLVQGWVTAEQIFQAGQVKLAFQPAVEQRNTSLAFTKLVFDQLDPQIPYAQLARGGYRIITTLDYDLQMQAVCASEAIINRLQAQSGEVTTPDGTPCSAARLISSPSMPELEPFFAQASVIILNPQNGQVLSLVSNLPGESQAAFSSKHNPGSLLAPFIALTAFTRGFNPSSLLWDLPAQTTENASGGNSETTKYHGPVSLRAAIANDYVGATSQIVNQVGKDSILRTIRQFGFDADDEISLLEAVQAFGILANQGIRRGKVLQSPETSHGQELQPTTILSVEDNQGKIWLDWSSPDSQSVLSAQLAYLINHVLSDESVRWSSLGHPNPLEIGRPVAVKIGKTSSLTEEWTVGYTPQKVIGVWMGPSSETNQQLPAHPSASLWHALMQVAMSDIPVADWMIPAGMKTTKVCEPSGLLPTNLCPAVAVEVFIEGNEPNQYDNLYRKYQINRETGNLATVFTPPELVEERVFLSLPPEAVSWAQATGLDVPPGTYDAIYAPPEPSPSVQISSPALFEHVSGQITFKGSASGENFQSYRLQVGKGLNPQEWIQIGNDSEQPVINGTLGVWNTQDSSGLYSIQLLVVRKDQRVARFVTQITVDNQSPQVLVVNPNEGQVISRAKSDSILFQVEASDDLELAQVSFSVDGILIASLSQAPFALPWQTPPAGKHELLVEAVDLAGNKSQSILSFEVK